VIETGNAKGEEWGTERLQQLVEQNKERSTEDILSAIFEAMHQYSHGCQIDDATIAVLRVL